MGAFFCRHRPACPTGIGRWTCAQRSIVEQGMAKGTISEGQGTRLLALYGVPRSQVQKAVYTGARPVTQGEKLFP